VIPKSGYRFSDEITLKQRLETPGSDLIGTDKALKGGGDWPEAVEAMKPKPPHVLTSVTI
jgi:hypothetical protein